MKRVYSPGRVEVKVKKSKTGLGLFAFEDIPKNICITEYTGRQIKGEEEYTSTSKYLFEVHTRLTIDGRDKNNIARYINHSCRPNCEPVIYKSRVYIFSIKNINKDDELTYDYGKDYWNEHIKPIGCKCSKCVEKVRK